MHLETSSLESSTRVYPQTTGYESFDNVGLRLPTSTFGNTPSNNTTMYGLSPYSMFNQYTNSALWKTTSHPVDDYSKSMLKSENILFGSSADDFYSTQSLFKTFDEHAEKSESDDALKVKSEQTSINSEISLTIDQTSTISTPEQVSPSPSTSSDGSSQSGTLKKKARTVFTNNQLRDLRATFAKKKYLTTDERMKLAAEIGLSHTKIKTWFQNRRMKWKRENHCTVPGLIPTMPQDCLPQPHTSTMLAMSNLPALHPNPSSMLGGIPNVPAPATSSHLQMSTSLQTTTPSCLPQAMYSQTFTNGYYSMNNSMLGHSMSSSQNLFNNEFTKYSPLPPMSLTDTPTYDTSYMGYPACSKYPYQSLPTSLPTYTNRDNLLMVAPPTQSYLPS